MCFCAALSVALARSAFALTAITTISWASGCSGGSVGLCVFSLTHLFLQPPGCHSAVKRCSWRTLCCAPHARAGFVQSSAALGSGPLQAPLFGSLAFSFSPLSHKRYGELLHSLLPCLQLCASLLTHRLFQRTSTFAAPLRGSVCACSHEPGAGLRRPLMCCLVFLLTGLSPLQLCLPCHLRFL